ncbi:MAG: multidrug ABC transporter permease [Rhodanobacter sp.]|nr:MAG: multidrug ABC transporter permease [Rhodanobacter sp.]TAM41392.1 MAG: multidrug ABC transporter permease [Rhodanobacter sp.]
MSSTISIVSHVLQALVALSSRETVKFMHQRGRLLSAVVRPSLWLLIFAAGFRNVFGVSVIPPYSTYIEYQVYVVPGLVGIVLLFNGMQSSLAMVYDREMGLMRLLLTAPLPRSVLLTCKLLAGTFLSILQAYAFLAICALFQLDLPWWPGLLLALPAMFLTGLMLGAMGLLVSVYIKQIENFAGAMNFVIFPMFFLSPALYPLWKLQESGAEFVYQLARINPFTYGIDLIRYAMYGQMNWLACGVVVAALIVFLGLAIWGYDPQRGMVRHKHQGG